MAVTTSGGALEWVARIEFSELEKQVAEITRQLTGVAKKANEEASAIEKLIKRTVGAIATYATFASGTNLIRDIVRVRGEFQQLEVAFTTMLGSKSKADKLLAEVTEFAASTPFELKEVAQATKQLLAFGISADDVKDELRSLGDISAGIGAPLGEIAYLFGTIKTQGVALTQDVRQFAQRGIPVYEELAKVLGVSVEKVGALITAGKVGFPQIQQVFRNLTAEGSKFGGLMEAQSKTLLGLQSNLRDSIDQMLNDIGKSSEGIFTDLIKGATFLVENYEKVVDIIKILAVTYGTYRTALILTNIAEQISIARKVALYTTGKALTVVQALQTAGTLALQKVTRLLNLTMLANPYVAITTLVVGLVSAMAILHDSTTAQEKAQRSLHDSNEEYQEDIDNLKSKTNDLVSIIGNETSTRFAQVRAFDELKGLYPDLLRNMDLMGFKTLSAEDAQKRFNESIEKNNLQKLKDDFKAAQEEVERLTESLRQAREANLQGSTIGDTSDLLEFAAAKAQLLAEEVKKVEQALFDANTPIEKQIEHYNKIKDGLVKQRDQIERNLEKIKETGIAAIGFGEIMENINLNNLNAQLDVITSKLNALTGGGVDPIRDKAFFTKQKTDAQAAIDALDIADKDFNSKKLAQVKIIRDAERELEKYDTTLKKSTKSTGDNSKVQAELNSLLEQRISLIKSLNDQIKQSEDFGKGDEVKELDRINERYDDLILTVDKYNKKVAEFNKKNPKSKVQGVGQFEINRLNQARATDLDNVFLKADADRFSKNLEEKQALYEQYEEAKKQVGIEKADELFSELIKDNKSFLEVLTKQAELLAPKFFFGMENEGDKLKSESIFEQMTELNKKNNEQQLEDNKSNFLDLLSLARTFNDQKAAINKKFDDLEAELNRNTNLSDFEERKRLLAEGRAEELEQLKNDQIRQSALYKKLNQDILGFTRQRLKDELKLLKEQLKINTTLTPQQKADIQGVIDQYKGLLDSTNKTAKQFKKVAEDLSQVSGIFGELADATEGLDDGLSNLFQGLSDIAGIAGDAAGAIASFATGDILGGIGQTVSVITKIFSIGKKAREEQKRHQKEVQEFLTAQFTGEQEINLLYQERAREQVKINKLRLQGLEDERKLLKEQKTELQSQFETVFQELQKETFVIKLTIPDLFGTTKDVFTTQSLFGKTFQELEELFLKGQLEGRAKELFQTLEKIKASGLDVDKILAENKKAAQEIFTGTTADSITDSIIAGLKEGRRGIVDFASDFQELMQQAMLNALKFKYLEGPIKTFFEDFAAASESDGQLTSGEIDRLKAMYNTIITNAADQFEQLQQVAGINFSSTGGGANTLTGAIRGMTEQQADLLAGQFGGLRITAVEQLRVAMRGIETLQKIEVNTARLIPMYDLWRRIELNGLKAL